MDNNKEEMIALVDLANIYRGIVGGNFERSADYSLVAFLQDLKIAFNAVASFLSHKRKTDFFISEINVFLDPATFKKDIRTPNDLNKLQHQVGTDKIFLNTKVKKDIDHDIAYNVQKKSQHYYTLVFSGDRDIYDLYTGINENHKERVFFVTTKFDFFSDLYKEHNDRFINLFGLTKFKQDEYSQLDELLNKWKDLISNKTPSDAPSPAPTTQRARPSPSAAVTNESKPQKANPETSNKSPTGVSNPQAEIFFENEENSVLQNKMFRKARASAYVDHAILIIGCRNITIENVTVEGSERACIRIINSENIKVKGCTLIGSRNDQGINVTNSSKIFIENTQCLENTGSGIYIQNGSSEVSLKNCILSKNTQSGLRIKQAENIVLQASQLSENNNGNGLYVSNAKQLEVLNSELLNNDFSGAQFEKCTGINIYQSQFSQNQKNNGIYLTRCSEVEITASQFKANPRYGLDIKSSNSCNLSDNTFGQNPLGSSYIQDSEVSITKCHFEETAEKLNLVKAKVTTDLAHSLQTVVVPNETVCEEIAELEQAIDAVNAQIEGMKGKIWPFGKKGKLEQLNAEIAEKRAKIAILEPNKSVMQEQVQDHELFEKDDESVIEYSA